MSSGKVIEQGVRFGSRNAAFRFRPDFDGRHFCGDWMEAKTDRVALPKVPEDDVHRFGSGVVIFICLLIAGFCSWPDVAAAYTYTISGSAESGSHMVGSTCYQDAMTAADVFAGQATAPTSRIANIDTSGDVVTVTYFGGVPSVSGVLATCPGGSGYLAYDYSLHDILIGSAIVIVFSLGILGGALMI